MVIKMKELIEKTKINFGTSGIRGLEKEMTDFICYSYTIGFLKYLESKNEINKYDTRVAIAGDFRPSTNRMMNAIVKAVKDMHYIPIHCGKVPTPAITYFGINNNIPSIMVTGSHIPEDRNGIKFNKSKGEILKDDEKGIQEQIIEIPDDMFDTKGQFNDGIEIVEEYSAQKEVEDAYLKRYLDFFPKNALSGKKIGLYQHSAVGRDIIYRILIGLGANVTKLGYSDTFIPVDTEAIREDDIIAARKWMDEYKFDTIVSTDGDSDRPLISDETGKWLRGDISGILCAKYLQADSVSTTLSCNSAVEKCGLFKSVKYNKIGSPYVVASMIGELAKGYKNVVGYEANGGFLIGSNIIRDDRTLSALPTRDAVIIHLCIIMLSIESNKPISQLVDELPKRYTASDRIKNFPTEKGKRLLAQFSNEDDEINKKAVLNFFRKSIWES